MEYNDSLFSKGRYWNAMELSRLETRTKEYIK